MTKPLPFTKASIRRAIDSAREAGLRVTAIRHDGTVLAEDRSATPGDEGLRDSALGGQGGYQAPTGTGAPNVPTTGSVVQQGSGGKK